MEAFSHDDHPLQITAAIIQCDYILYELNPRTATLPKRCFQKPNCQKGVSPASSKTSLVWARQGGQDLQPRRQSRWRRYTFLQNLQGAVFTFHLCSSYAGMFEYLNLELSNFG